MRYKEAGTATIIFFADNNIHTVVRDPDEFTDTGPTIEEDVDTRQQMARFADIVGIPVHGSIVNREFGIPAVWERVSARSGSNMDSRLRSMVTPAHSREERTKQREISPAPIIPHRRGNATSSARVKPRLTSLGVKGRAGR